MASAAWSVAHAGRAAVDSPVLGVVALPKNKKGPRGSSPGGLLVNEIRRHLLSHFGYYHRLGKLNYRVRDGNGCGLSEMVTGKKQAAPVRRRLLGLCLKWERSGEQAGMPASRRRSRPPGGLGILHALWRSVEYMWPSIRPLVSVSLAHCCAYTSDLSTW